MKMVTVAEALSWPVMGCRQANCTNKTTHDGSESCTVEAHNCTTGPFVPANRTQAPPPPTSNHKLEIKTHREGIGRAGAEEVGQRLVLHHASLVVQRRVG